MAESTQQSTIEQMGLPAPEVAPGPELAPAPTPAPTPAPAVDSAAPLAPTDVPPPTESQARQEGAVKDAPIAPPVRRRYPGEKIGAIYQPIETTAGPAHIPYFSKEGEKHIVESKNLDARHSIAQSTLPHETLGLTTPEEMDRQAQPESLGSIFSVLHSFDLVRTASWLAAYSSEAILPDPTGEGAEPTEVSKVGDAMEWATGKIVSGMLDYKLHKPEISEGESDPFLTIGENIYNAFAQEDLLRQGLSRKVNLYSDKGSLGIPFVDLIGEEGIIVNSDGVDVPYPKGTDFLDVTVPIGVARKIASAQPWVDPKSMVLTTGSKRTDFINTVASKALWEALSTPTGREAVGLALEIIVDPLWLAGPASATARFASKGGKVYELGKPMVKMGGVIQDLMRVPKSKSFGAITDLVDGTSARKLEAENLMRGAEDIAALRFAEASNRVDELAAGLQNPKEAIRIAKSHADKAVAHLDELMKTYGIDNLTEKVRLAQKAKDMKLAELDRLGTSVGEASKYLKKQHKFALRERTVYGRQKDSLSHGRSLLARGMKNGMVVEKGSFAVHIPFGTKTTYLDPSKRVSQVLSKPLVKVSGTVSDKMKPYSMTKLAEKVAKEGEDALSGGERMAIAMHDAKGVAWEAGTKVVGPAAIVFDKLAGAFGTRYYQPIIGRFREHAEVPFREPRRLGLLSVPFLGDRYIAAKKVAPDVWQALQDAVGKHQRRTVYLQSMLMETSARMMKTAADTAKARSGEAKTNIPIVKKEIARLKRELATAVPADKNRLTLKIREAEGDLYRYEEWSGKEYGPIDIIFEAIDQYESGARLAKEQPHLVRAEPAITKMYKEFLEEYKKETGGSLDTVRLALFDMESSLIGSVEHHDRLRQEMADVSSGIKELLESRSRYHNEIEVMATGQRTRMAAMRTMVQQVGAGGLAKALERIRVGMQGRPYDSSVHYQFVENVLMDVFRNRKVVHDILDNAAIVMGEPNRVEAVVSLVKKMSTTMVKGEVTSARILGNSIKKTLNSMLANEDLIRRASIGDFSKEEEVKVMVSLLDAEFGKHMNAMRRIIGEDLMPHFSDWMKTGDLKEGWVKRFEQFLIDKGAHPRQQPAPKAEPGIADKGIVSKAIGEVAESFSTAPPGWTSIPTDVVVPKPNVGLGGRTWQEAADEMRKTRTGTELAQFIVDNADMPVHREIARRIMPHLDDTDVHVLSGSADDIPASVVRAEKKGTLGVNESNQIILMGAHHARLKRVARGLNFSHKDDAFNDVFLRARPRHNGTNAEIALHELIHAATVRRIFDGNLLANQGTAIASATSELFALHGKIARAVVQQRKAGKLDSLLEDTLRAIGKDPKELVAYGLTNKLFQDYLMTIRIDNQSGWSGFVQKIAKILGISPKNQNALSELMRTTDLLLDAPLAGLPARAQTKFISRATGPIKPPKTLAEMEALFKGERVVQRAPTVLPGAEKLIEAASAYKAARQLAVTSHKMLKPGETSKARALRAGIIKTTKRGDISPVMAELGSEGMLTRRIENLVADAKTEKEAVGRARVALEELLPLNKPYEKLIIDEMAERIGKNISSRLKSGRPRAAIVAGDIPTPVRAVIDAKKQALIRLQDRRGHLEAIVKREKGAPDEAREAKIANLRAKEDALKKELKEQEPRLQVGTKVRTIKEWEKELKRRFRGLPELQGLSENEILYAAASALKDMPRLDKQTKAWIEAMQKEYTKVVGPRFMDETKDLELVIDELSDLFRSYEQMFRDKGWDFVKDRDKMLKEWGVIEYVPHILTEAAKKVAARGSKAYKNDAEATAKWAEMHGASSIDARMSVNIPAGHKRQIDGTLREIDIVTNGPTQMTVDPAAIVARYMQANRAITGSEMAYALKRGGAIVAIRAKPGPGGSITEQAAKLDLVPLFGNASLERDFEILMTGTAADLRTAVLPSGEVRPITSGEILVAVERLKSWKKGQTAKDGEKSPIANWFRQTREASSILNTKETILTERAANMLHGEELINPESLYQFVQTAAEHQKRINAAVEAARKTAIRRANARGYSDAQRIEYAAKLTEEARAMEPWDIVAGIVNHKRSDRTTPKLTGHGLALTYGTATEPGAWGLFVARNVASSLERTLDISGVIGANWLPKQLIDRLISHWKIRVTIISAAFHGRNAVSNQLTNILDVGVYGALDPHTNFTSSQLSHAVTWVEEYGSLEKAKKALYAPQAKHESALAYKKRWLRRQAFDGHIGKWMDETIDLGDGIRRSVDEVIDNLKRHGVISGAKTQYLDINRYESSVATLATDIMSDKKQVLKEVLSGAEDAAMFGLTTLMTGGLPVYLPKQSGAAVGRFVENQARITNFLANFKQNGNFEVAADHASKFLFDYGDLTAFQKVWMRSFFPFFTWTQKNVVLQLEMMQKSPMFYSMMNHLMVDGIPSILMAEEEGRRPQMAPTPEDLRLRLGHTNSMLRIPLPESDFLGIPKDTYLTGMGWPIESFVEMMGMGSSLTRIGEENVWKKRPALRLMGMANPLVKAVYEMSAARHAHYDIPIPEMTNARRIKQMTMALGKIDPDLQKAVEMDIGLVTTYPERYDGTREERVKINGWKNWAFTLFPHSRSFSDAASMSDVLPRSMAYTAEEASGIAAGRKPLPKWIQLLDTLGLARVEQVDEETQRRVYEARKEAAQEKYFQEEDVAREGKYVRPVK